MNRVLNVLAWIIAVAFLGVAFGFPICATVDIVHDLYRQNWLASVGIYIASMIGFAALLAIIAWAVNRALDTTVK